MSKADAQKISFTDNLKRIYSLARQHRRPLPCLWEHPISSTDIVGWLSRRDGNTKWYWKSRDSRLEIGVAGFHPDWVFETANDDEKIRDLFDLLPDSNLMFLGAQRFSSTTPVDDTWSGFPGYIRALPRRMIIRRHDRFSYAECFTVTPDGDIDSMIALIGSSLPGLHADSAPNSILSAPVSIRHYPEFDRWRQNVEAGLAAISSGQIEKIVLARRTDYLFENNIDPWSLLTQLMRLNAKGYACLYQPAPGTIYLSVTPERLYRRTDRTIEIDALSSTMPRGATPETDRMMETELLNDSKQRHEHQCVIDGIAASISPLLRSKPSVGATSVMKLERIQHLATPINGNLGEGVGDREIIEALHPTPAVGGAPRDKALELIEVLEPFDRGWYAAPIGYITRHDAEFAVGIRSLLIHDNTISVFTGAGIVAGSNPEAEWREIDSKNILQPLLSEQVQP